jgi:hypothetical protein
LESSCSTSVSAVRSGTDRKTGLWSGPLSVRSAVLKFPGPDQRSGLRSGKLRTAKTGPRLVRTGLFGNSRRRKFQVATHVRISNWLTECTEFQSSQCWLTVRVYLRLRILDATNRAARSRYVASENSLARGSSSAMRPSSRQPQPCYLMMLLSLCFRAKQLGMADYLWLLGCPFMFPLTCLQYCIFLNRLTGNPACGCMREAVFERHCY